MQRIQSFSLRGIDALPVEIECDERPRREGSNDGGPRTTVVGLPDASVRESHQRVRAALAACRFPRRDGPGLAIYFWSNAVKKLAFYIRHMLAIWRYERRNGKFGKTPF